MDLIIYQNTIPKTPLASMLLERVLNLKDEGQEENYFALALNEMLSSNQTSSLNIAFLEILPTSFEELPIKFSP